MSSKSTIVFQPLNHIGLGHVNRLSAIALGLHRLDESIRTPFVIEGAAHPLLDALGLAYVPLPASHTVFEECGWAAWGEDERRALLTEISRSILRAFDPQIVVFDGLPARAFLPAVLESKVPIVLCLREMRDLDGYLRHVSDWLRHVTLILVPHQPGAFQLPHPLREKSLFTGPIARPAPARKSNGDMNRPRVVINGGGGGYPGTVDFYNLAMKAVDELRRTYPALEARLIAGPLFQGWLQLAPVSAVPIIPFDPDMPAVFAAADLVISQAGYNTVAELEQIGTKTILVPAPRPWDDQFARARRAVQALPFFRLFEGHDAAGLARVAEAFLRDAVSVAPSGHPQGAAHAAERLCAMLK